MVLIEFKHRFGKIFINPEYIASIAPYDDNSSAVCIANDSTPLIIEETTDSILEKINNAYDEH